MSYGQRSIWFQLITTLALAGYFSQRFCAKYSAGAFDGPEGMMAVGRTMLLIIAVAIVANIAVHILGTILLAIATGDEDPDTTTDERDRAIERRGERVSQWVSGAGFVAAMALLATGTAAALVIGLMFLAFATGDITGNIVKLISYGRS